MLFRKLTPIIKSCARGALQSHVPSRMLSNVGNAKIPQISSFPSHMEVLAKERPLQLNYIWLRDHCRCPQCYRHSTNQKEIDLREISVDIKPDKVDVDESSLDITWPDGHQSNYSIQWLEENTYNPRKRAGMVERVLWNPEMLTSMCIPEVHYEEFMQSDEPLKDLLVNLYRYGFGIVQGAPATIQGTTQVAERVSFLQETFFGKDWSFSADLKFGDTAYTNIALGPHHDSTYFSQPTGIQVFHVLEHDGKGGETLLVDGFYIAEKLRKEHPDVFKILKETKIPHEYKDSGHHHYSLDTIIKTHPVTDELIWMRYNRYDRGPLDTVPYDKIPDIYNAFRVLTNEIEAPGMLHWVKLRPGMVLFVDNWRAMHGRSAYTGFRKVCGSYLPREDWLSKARVLNIL